MPTQIAEIVVLGKAAGTYAGKVIGYADKAYTAGPGNGVYLEVIVQNVQPGGGARHVAVHPQDRQPVWISGK
jgi:hypothetical protein